MEKLTIKDGKKLVTNCLQMYEVSEDLAIYTRLGGLYCGLNVDIPNKLPISEALFKDYFPKYKQKILTKAQLESLVIEEVNTCIQIANLKENLSQKEDEILLIALNKYINFANKYKVKMEFLPEGLLIYKPLKREDVDRFKEEASYSEQMISLTKYGFISIYEKLVSNFSIMQYVGDGKIGYKVMLGKEEDLVNLKEKLQELLK